MSPPGQPVAKASAAGTMSVFAYTSEPPPTPAPPSTSTSPSQSRRWMPWQPTRGSHRYLRRFQLLRGKSSDRQRLPSSTTSTR